MLSRHGNVSGFDHNRESVEHALSRKICDVRIGGLSGGPSFPGESFDLVTLLDVLEHIDDDVAPLISLHDILNPGGHIIIAVPALPILWSSHDIVHGHMRRYTAASLRAAVVAAGFEPVYLSYFNTIFLPLMALPRLYERIAGLPEDNYLKLPWGPVNTLMTWIFSLERHIIGRVSLPVGGSLIMAGRKK